MFVSVSPGRKLILMMSEPEGTARSVGTGVGVGVGLGTGVVVGCGKGAEGVAVGIGVSTTETGEGSGAAGLGACVIIVVGFGLGVAGTGVAVSPGVGTLVGVKIVEVGEVATTGTGVAASGLWVTDELAAGVLAEVVGTAAVGCCWQATAAASTVSETRTSNT